MTKLNYKCAIVTGASSGIGAAIAKELCSHDILVLGVARNKANLDQVKLSLPKEQRKLFRPLIADISKQEDVKKISLVAKKNGVDLLINNAGVGLSAPFEKHTPADVQNIITANFTGTSMLSHSLLLTRPSKKSLHIVFVSSLAGKIGFPELSIYSATKFALEGLAESLRYEYVNMPVRITVLRPGVTDTNFFNNAGMKNYYDSVKGANKIHSAESVALKLINNLDTNNGVVTVRADKLFLRVLPFIPFSKRFNILELTNKFQ